MWTQLLINPQPSNIILLEWEKVDYLFYWFYLLNVLCTLIKDFLWTRRAWIFIHNMDCAHVYFTKYLFYRAYTFIAAKYSLTGRVGSIYIPITFQLHYISITLHFNYKYIPNTLHYIPITDGCVHMRTNHVPKDVSDRNPKRDWDRDLNYVRSHALQTPSQSRSGSAHCEVIFCSYCAVRADWPMHGFSAHFQNAHARITFRKSFAFTCPRIRLSTRITIQNAFFFLHFKTRFKSLIWNSFAFTRAKIRLSNQERAESRSKRLSERDSFSCEQAQCYTSITLHYLHSNYKCYILITLHSNWYSKIPITLYSNYNTF